MDFCSYCGEEIADGKQVCDKCQNRNKSKKTKTALVVAIVIIGIIDLFLGAVILYQNMLPKTDVPEKNNTENVEENDRTVIDNSENTIPDEPAETENDAAISNTPENGESSSVLSGNATYTGTMRVRGLSCYLELSSPITYQESLDDEPVASAELWLSENDAGDFKGYNGLTVTLEGVLFNYRGSGSLMFDGSPTIVNDAGTPEVATESSSYADWDSTDNETKFWDALEVLRTIIYRCNGVWDVRTLCDGGVLDRIKTNGFSPFDGIMLQINDSWIENYGYEAYVTPEEDGIIISLGPNEAPSIPTWKYDWEGNLISGDGTLEEYILSNGLI